MQELTLYFRPMCPFCRKVLGYLQENNISVTMKDVTESSIHQELSEIGGKTQVPCLIIDGKPLYESDDIIQWFKDNKGK